MCRACACAVETSLNLSVVPRAQGCRADTFEMRAHTHICQLLYLVNPHAPTQQHSTDDSTLDSPQKAKTATVPRTSCYSISNARKPRNPARAAARACVQCPMVTGPPYKGPGSIPPKRCPMITHLSTGLVPRIMRTITSQRGLWWEPRAVRAFGGGSSNLMR